MQNPLRVRSIVNTNDLQTTLAGCIPENRFGCGKSPHCCIALVQETTAATALNDALLVHVRHRANSASYAHEAGHNYDALIHIQTALVSDPSYC
jgi:hypothetical protein